MNITRSRGIPCVLAALLLGPATHAAAAAEPATVDGLFQAIRDGNNAAVEAALATEGAIHARDDLGNTPLMAAALHADGAVLEWLIKAGADVNATNKEGATALMRAAIFEDKVRKLVANGADVHARSALGNTALLLAARRHGNTGAVKFLLDQGAEIDATNGFGATALMTAVAAEDTDTVRLLLDRGADVNAKPNMDADGFLWGGGRTPLMWAAFRGNQRMIELLLARGANVNDVTPVGSALTQAAWAGQAAAAKMLLDAGARVDQRDRVANFTPLHWAASTERLDPSLVELLLAHHADANAEGGQPVDGFLGVAQTPVMLARKRGETPIVQALLKSGAREGPAVAEKRAEKPARSLAGPANSADIAEALQLAVPRLQRSAIDSQATFLKHASKQDCISCHQQQLPVSAISLARTRHMAIDEEAARKQIEAVARFGWLARELDLQATFHPEPAIGNGYALFALQLDRQPRTPVTDSLVHQLAVTQCPDGSWMWNLPRPPIQSSAIAATALAARAIRYYAMPGRQREFDQRVRRAGAWLGKARPELNEERAYQLLGLAWTGEGSAKLAKLAEGLISEQRPDGGWGQLPKLASDAFATGQALYALMEGGAVSPSHPAVQRGLEFLLRTQLVDGTWHIRRRAFPFQPPMDSGFAHGADGWISAAGTSWAVMALALALDPSEPFPTREAPALATAGTSAAAAGSEAGAVVPETTPVEFARDIQPLLERSCVACHSGQRAKGGFKMVNRAALLQGGNRGEAAIVAHHSDQSPLIRFVTDQVEDLEMPPLGKREKFPALTTDETARLRAWIDQGALWPDGVELRLPGP